MKRFKSLLAGLCTLALVVAFAVGNFGYVPTAYAAAGTVEIKSSSIAFGTAKAPAKTVKYGAEFAVPTATGSNITVTVTNPAGKRYNAEADGKYYARMLGNYIIEYKIPTALPTPIRCFPRSTTSSSSALPKPTFRPS